MTWDSSRSERFQALESGPVEAFGTRPVRLRAVSARYGVDLRTAALQFSSAADVAVALVVGARSAQQIEQDYNSLQAKIPSDFWAELRKQGLIAANASLPASPE